MPPEPALKRTIVFVDGQNLFHAVRDTFGYPYPNYDVEALARAVTRVQHWQLIQTRFYTGLPDSGQDAQWHQFWSRKMGVMGRQGVDVFARPLSYRSKTVRLPDGSTHTFLAAEEKGVDVRMALDIVRMAHRCDYDVALILSQDPDLSPRASSNVYIALPNIPYRSTTNSRFGRSAGSCSPGAAGRAVQLSAFMRREDGAACRS